MPVVDERGTLIGIVTTDDAWEAIEEELEGEKSRATGLMIVGGALAVILLLGLYTLVLLQSLSIAGYLTW